MKKATCSEVALGVVSAYPDHGVGPDDPGLGMLALFIRLLCVWVSQSEQDGVEQSGFTVVIGAVDPVGTASEIHGKLFVLFEVGQLE